MCRLCALEMHAERCKALLVKCLTVVDMLVQCGAVFIV